MDPLVVKNSYTVDEKCIKQLLKYIKQLGLLSDGTQANGRHSRSALLVSMRKPNKTLSCHTSWVKREREEQAEVRTPAYLSGGAKQKGSKEKQFEIETSKMSLMANTNIGKCPIIHTQPIDNLTTEKIQLSSNHQALGECLWTSHHPEEGNDASIHKLCNSKWW
uniref:Uncharacterized protein n=1 Tax=Glossina pallidipes TaxID=7398 RepID=A0A1A9ZME0_GLOPL